MENKKILKEHIDSIDLNFDERFYERCCIFISLLQEWGSVHNFTSFKSLKTDIIIENIADSLYPLRFLNNFNTIMDVGTGAGYPGIILAIGRPDINVILVEPKSKRVSFLNYLKTVLKLKNVTILNKRVEDLSNINCDLITSRAVTNISLLLKLTKNIANSQTEYLFYKGSLCEEEIKKTKLNNYKIINNGEFRNFLYIKKDT